MCLIVRVEAQDPKMTLLQANLVFLSCLFYDQTRELIIKLKMRLNLFQESPGSRCGELGNLELFLVDHFFFSFFVFIELVTTFLLFCLIFWLQGMEDLDSLIRD